MTISKRFMHYLLSLPLTEQFYFSEENQGVSFHWSNWDTFCNLLCKHEEFVQRRNELIFEISQKVAPLKDETIWINSADKTTKSNMYDLYSLYLDAKVREGLFHSEKQILYSEGNSSGPFHSLSSLKWKNKEVYKLFILDKILKGSSPLRKFRLNVDLNVGVVFDKFPLRNSQAHVEQFTEYGLILKLASSKDFFCLSNSNRIKLQMQIEDLNDLSPFKKLNLNLEGQNELEVSFSPDVLEHYGNRRNFSHSREDQIFVFVGHRDFKVSPTTDLLIPFFQDILKVSKQEIEALLEEFLAPLQTRIQRVS